MGAQKSSTIPNSHRFSLEEWQQCPLIPYTNIQDPYFGSNFSLYANRLNPFLQLEKYDLFFNNYSEFLAYRELTNWRSNLRYVVQVNHLQEPGKRQFCGAFYHAQAYLERTPIRLVEIQDISLQEGLCIIYGALQGFQKLYGKFGYFQPQAELVCFNREGFVKVWVNQNLSKNHPENIYVQGKYKTYPFFVQQLLTMLQKLIDFEGHPKISQFIAANRIANPYEQMMTVLQLYAKEIQKSVPRYLSSIRNICQGRRRKSHQGSKELPRNLIQNRPSISQKSSNSNRLQLDEQTFGYTPNSHTMREPLEQLNFKKSASFNQTYRYLSQTSRPSPPVRFHYRTNPGSPTNRPETSVSFPRKAHNSFNSPQHSNENQRPVSFLKPKRSLTKMYSGSMDPEIAADLALLEK